MRKFLKKISSCKVAQKKICNFLKIFGELLLNDHVYIVRYICRLQEKMWIRPTGETTYKKKTHQVVDLKVVWK